MEPRKTGPDPQLLRLMMPHRMGGESEDVQARITEALTALDGIVLAS